jgi:hypothetical protein
LPIKTAPPPRPFTSSVVGGGVAAPTFTCLPLRDKPDFTEAKLDRFPTAPAKPEMKPHVSVCANVEHLDDDCEEEPIVTRLDIFEEMKGRKYLAIGPEVLGEEDGDIVVFDPNFGVDKDDEEFTEFPFKGSHKSDVASRSELRELDYDDEKDGDEEVIVFDYNDE